jgi:protein SCO1/2
LSDEAQPRGPSALRTGVALLGIGCLGIVAVWTTTSGGRYWTSEALRRARIEATPPVLSALDLRSPSGKELRPWGAARAPARAFLVSFIYTSCPTLCSTAGDGFGRLQRDLDADGGSIRLLSLSFDPGRDDSLALRTYAERHRADPSRWLVAAPTSEPALEKLLDEAGVVVISDGRGGYAHNGGIHVVLADGRLVGVFDLAQAQEALECARRWAS